LIFQYKTGKPIPEVGTPLGSVIVAIKFLAVVVPVLPRGVYAIFGGFKSRGIPANSSAPISGAAGGYDGLMGYPAFGYLAFPS